METNTISNETTKNIKTQIGNYSKKRNVKEKVELLFKEVDF